MKRIPMCWKCKEAILEQVDLPDAEFVPSMTKLIGCKENSNIKSYGSACVLCPLIQPKEVKHDSNFCEGQRD